MDPEETDDDLETEDEFEELDEGEEPEEELLEEPPEGETVEEEPPARKPSRAEARIEALDRTAKEAMARAEAAERRVNELLSGSSRSEAEQRERKRQEELAAMDPWDRVQAETRGELGSIRREIADSKDQAEFARACAANPAVAKVADEVEKQLKDARSRGVDVPRSTLAAYIIGQQVLEKAPKARERAAKKAAANIDRERTRASTGGVSESPVRGRESNDKAARDKRLEGYVF